MNRKFLKQENSDKCILFFNGWGMDENAVKHLSNDNFDICVFNDYKSNNDIENDFNSYEELYLIAWSLGVWFAASAITKSKIKIKRSIAFNGTLNPISENEGIPKNIFEGTLNNWNDKNRIKFNIRQMGGRAKYQQFRHLLSNRNSSDQREELQCIMNEILTDKKPAFNFDKAIIGTNDLIFLPEYQKKYWYGKIDVVEIDSPHFPFSAFDSWNDIVELMK